MTPSIEMSSAVRRSGVSDSSDAAMLEKLLCDEKFFVRRKALAHEFAPRDIIALLVRAGASADLRGRAAPDPAVSAEELARLAALGPFGRELAAAHPNAGSRLLECIATNSSRPLLLTILKHAECPATLLREACLSMDAEERRLAARHANTPADVLQDLFDAGADSQLQTVRPAERHAAVVASIDVSAVKIREM